MSETAYEVVPAKALETVDETLTVVPAHTVVVPDGVIVTEGAWDNPTCQVSGKITSKSLNHFIA